MNTTLERTAEEIRSEIMNLVREYYDTVHARKTFVPGKTKVAYAGRVFDRSELEHGVESVLQYWLTAGPFANKFEKCRRKFSGGVDAVVQLAAISNDPMGKTFASVTRDVNHEASLAVARKAKAAGVKWFVFASSCSVYGFAEDGARNESSSLNSLTAYAQSKVAAEEGLRSLAGPDFRVTCLRFATACGWSPRLRLDLVLNDFVASALASKRIDILSDGTPWRPLIDVQDVARAIEWAVTRDRGPGGDYLVINAGSNRWNFRIKELAAAVQRFLPEVQVSINPNAQPDKRSYRVDFSLFERLAPRHQPTHELADSIAELKAGLDGMNFSDRDFRNSRFIRLKALAALKAAGLLDDDLFWKRPGGRL